MGSLVRLVAIVSSGLVLLGFACFATDELSHGSKNQQNALGAELDGAPDPAPVAPSPDQEATRERVNGKFREVVDGRERRPARPVRRPGRAPSNRWVTHGVPTILALLLYGLLPRDAREHAAEEPRARRRLANRRVLAIRYGASRRNFPCRGCCGKASQAPSPAASQATGTGEPIGWQPCRPGRIADLRAA